MHVSLVFDLIAAFAKIGPRFPPLASIRRTAGGSFHRTAADVPISASRSGDRPGRGAPLLSRREDTPEMTGPVGIALIGMGWWGQKMLNVLQARRPTFALCARSSRTSRR